MLNKTSNQRRAVAMLTYQQTDEPSKGRKRKERRQKGNVGGNEKEGNVKGQKRTTGKQTDRRERKKMGSEGKKGTRKRGSNRDPAKE